MKVERRLFLLFAASALIAPALPTVVYAKDGGGDGGGGHDDGGGQDDGGHDDGGHHGEGGGGKRRDDDDLSQDEALRELQSGRVISLQAALRIVYAKIDGKVIDVNLSNRRGQPQYRMKVRLTNGAITTIRLDARNGRFIGLLGF